MILKRRHAYLLHSLLLLYHPLVPISLLESIHRSFLPFPRRQFLRQLSCLSTTESRCLPIRVIKRSTDSRPRTINSLVSASACIRQNDETRPWQTSITDGPLRLVRVYGERKYLPRIVYVSTIPRTVRPISLSNAQF